MDAAPASVDQALASPGRPLEPALRQDMEQRFGHDFSRVRVHSGAAAEQSARDVNAHAYTVGHNIVFGAGRFAPGTHEGRRLIAHELTHVVQQSGAEGMRADSSNEKRGQSPMSLATTPRNTSEASSPSRTPLPSVAPSGFGLAAIQGAAGHMSIQHAAREEGGEAAPVHSESALNFLSVGHDPDVARMLALQRSAGNAGVARMVSGARAGTAPRMIMRDRQAGPDLDRDKGVAHNYLDQLAGALDDHAMADRRWFSENWIDFISKTSQNPALSWSDDVAYAAVSNSLGNAASLVVEKYVVKKTATTLAGKAFGFVLGVVIETAAGIILDIISGKSSSEDVAAAEASKRTGKMIADREAELDPIEDKAKAAGRSKVSELRKEVLSATDPEKVYEIQREALESKTAAEKKPSRSDHTLAKRMLEEWVLEDAAHDEAADKWTSDAQWDEAKKEAFGKGESLNDHKEIFAYQTRGHFEKVGLPGQVWAQTVINGVKALSTNPSTRGSIEGVYDGFSVEFRSTAKPAELIDLIGKERKRKLSEDGEKAIKEGRFRLKITLDLEEDDGAVYIDHWKYDLSLVGPSGTQWWRGHFAGTRPAAGAIEGSRRHDADVDFDVSPD